MTDITTRLRSIYVAEGANYVTEAADLIDKLRAERDTLVNDVHSCHAGCHKVGCVNWVLRNALSAMLTHMGMDEDEWNKPTFDQARKALEQTK